MDDITMKAVDMPETTGTLPEIEMQPGTAEAPKPYTFRKLGAKDVFLVLKIIKAIGLKEFKQCFESAEILGLIQNMSDDEKRKDAGAMMVGTAVFLDIADIICGNIGKCENEIYKLLSDTTGIPVNEITAEGNAVMFFEMVLDFVQLPEFPDFFEAVSKRFF